MELRYRRPSDAYIFPFFQSTPSVSSLYRTIGADRRFGKPEAHQFTRHRRQPRVQARWRAESTYRPANLGLMAQRKKVDPGPEFQTSVRLRSRVSGAEPVGLDNLLVTSIDIGIFWRMSASHGRKRTFGDRMVGHCSGSFWRLASTRESPSPSGRAAAAESRSPLARPPVNPSQTYSKDTRDQRWPTKVPTEINSRVRPRNNRRLCSAPLQSL